jgi:hypothetical protein
VSAGFDIVVAIGDDEIMKVKCMGKHVYPIRKSATEALASKALEATRTPTRQNEQSMLVLAKCYSLGLRSRIKRTKSRSLVDDSSTLLESRIHYPFVYFYDLYSWF